MHGWLGDADSLRRVVAASLLAPVAAAVTAAGVLLLTFACHDDGSKFACLGWLAAVAGLASLVGALVYVATWRRLHVPRAVLCATLSVPVAGLCSYLLHELAGGGVLGAATVAPVLVGAQIAVAAAVRTDLLVPRRRAALAAGLLATSVVATVAGPAATAAHSQRVRQQYLQAALQAAQLVPALPTAVTHGGWLRAPRLEQSDYPTVEVRERDDQERGDGAAAWALSATLDLPALDDAGRPLPGGAMETVYFRQLRAESASAVCSNSRGCVPIAVLSDDRVVLGLRRQPFEAGQSMVLQLALPASLIQAEANAASVADVARAAQLLGTTSPVSGDELLRDRVALPSLAPISVVALCPSALSMLRPAAQQTARLPTGTVATWLAAGHAESRCDERS